MLRTYHFLDVTPMLVGSLVLSICQLDMAVNIKVLLFMRCFMPLGAGMNRADQTEIYMLES